jgi:RNA polymerase sigma factor (sigma-70 family)
MTSVRTLRRPDAAAVRELDDRALIARVTGGDREAFEALYVRYGDRIFGFCERILGSRHEAADATQETFVKLLQRLPTLDVRHGTVQPYLYTMARNVCYDVLRASRRQDLCEDVPDDAHARMRGPVAVEDDPERAVLHDAHVREIREAHGRLPERYREVLALREISEFSYDQIGEIMGLNRNAVAQLISRARLHFRDELRGTAASSVCLRGEECRRATAMLSQRHDRVIAKAADEEWLADHLMRCSSCRVAREALADAGRSYRLLAPAGSLAALKLFAEDAWASGRVSASTAPRSRSGVRRAGASMVLAVAGVLLVAGATAPGVREPGPVVEPSASVSDAAASRSSVARRAPAAERHGRPRTRRVAQEDRPRTAVPSVVIPHSRSAATQPAASAPLVRAPQAEARPHRRAVGELDASTEGIPVPRPPEPAPEPEPEPAPDTPAPVAPPSPTDPAGGDDGATDSAPACDPATTRCDDAARPDPVPGGPAPSPTAPQP